MLKTHAVIDLTSGGASDEAGPYADLGLENGS